MTRITKPRCPSRGGCAPPARARPRRRRRPLGRSPWASPATPAEAAVEATASPSAPHRIRPLSPSFLLPPKQSKPSGGRGVRTAETKGQRVHVIYPRGLWPTQRLAPLKLATAESLNSQYILDKQGNRAGTTWQDQWIERRETGANMGSRDHAKWMREGGRDQILEANALASGLLFSLVAEGNNSLTLPPLMM